MSRWQDRVVLASSISERRAPSKISGTFTLVCSFDSAEEFHRAEEFIATLVTAGMKPEILDSIREELEDKISELEEVRANLKASRAAVVQKNEEIRQLKEILAPLQALTC